MTKQVRLRPVWSSLVPRPMATQKSGKGPGVTFKDSHMCCQQSSFGVEESCSSIANYNIPLPVWHSLEHLHVTNVTSLWCKECDYQDELRNMLTRHIWEFLQVTPGPFPDFLCGAWDEGDQWPVTCMSQCSTVRNCYSSYYKRGFIHPTFIKQHKPLKVVCSFATSCPLGGYTFPSDRTAIFQAATSEKLVGKVICHTSSYMDTNTQL